MARKLKIQVPEFIMAPMSDDFRYRGHGSPAVFKQWDKKKLSASRTNTPALGETKILCGI